MNSPKQRSQTIKHIIINATKLPLIFLFIGVVLIALSYIDDVFPLTKWKNLFNITDQVGTIFMAIALVDFIYRLAVYTCRHIESKLKRNHRIATMVLANLRKSLRIVFLLAVINIVISLLGPTKNFLVLANNIIYCIILASIGWIAIQLFYTMEAVAHEHTMRSSRQVHMKAKALYTSLHILRNVATVIIIVLTASAIFMSFSNFRTVGVSLLASAGVLTAIVGLSAQKTLMSLFSGLQIAISQTIKIGDIVVIDSVSGIVEEITFTFVTLKLDDRRRLVVPINFFIEKSFENWSGSDSLTSSMYLYADYMLPIQPVRDMLNTILRESTYWDGEDGKLQVSNLTERAVQLRIQVSASNADDLSSLRAEVREKILDFIRMHYPNHFPKVRFNNTDHIKKSDSSV